MAEPTPAFTDSFLVESNNYGDFIRIVRQNVIKYCSDRRPGIVQPVLPREEKVPKFWFHVILRTSRSPSAWITSTSSASRPQLECGGSSTTSRAPTSSMAPIGSASYQDLVGQKGLETVALGRAQMMVAVDVLAKHGMATKVPEELLQDAPYDVPKSMLVKLVIMICEGLRFETVYRTVDKEFNKVEARITQLEGKQVNKWDRISKAVFKWAVDPTAKFPELEKIAIKNKTDAEKIVLLVKDDTA